MLVHNSMLFQQLAQTITTGSSDNYSTATDNATNATTTSGGNATGGNNRESSKQGSFNRTVL